MKSLIERIKEVLPTDTNRHSFFQIKYFIIGKEPTTQGRIHACLRELRERKSSLENIELEIAEMVDDSLVLNDRANNLDDEGHQQIEKRKIKRRVNHTEKKIKTLREKMMGIEQESLFLLEMLESLLKQEPIKDWDDFGVQLEYWNAKLLHELKTSLMLTGKVSNDLVSSIMALPDDASAKMQLSQVYKSISAIEQKRIEKKEAK